jgi:hypothetical protein
VQACVEAIDQRSCPPGEVLDRHQGFHVDPWFAR